MKYRDTNNTIIDFRYVFYAGKTYDVTEDKLIDRATKQERPYKTSR